jgi:hypothetical protein
MSGAGLIITFFAGLGWLIPRVRAMGDLPARSVSEIATEATVAV